MPPLRKSRPSIPMANPYADDEDEEGLDLPTRLANLERMQNVDISLSDDASVNYDSILFLAKFACGVEVNLFLIIKAFQTTGASRDQIARIVKLLAEFATNSGKPEAFPSLVADSLNIVVTRRKQFPPAQAPISEEANLEFENFQRKRAEQAKLERARAEETQRLDKTAADLLGVAVVPIEDEWGWRRHDTGEFYSPTSDPAIAFELMQTFSLDITHRQSDTMVSFFVNSSYRMPLTFSTADHNGSLARTICIAAIQRSYLKNRD